MSKSTQPSAKRSDEPDAPFNTLNGFTISHETAVGTVGLDFFEAMAAIYLGLCASSVLSWAAGGRRRRRARERARAELDLLHAQAVQAYATAELHDAVRRVYP